MCTRVVPTPVGVNRDMPLIGAETFLQACHTFRAVWFRGRYGGGKTLLSVHVGKLLHRRWKYQLFTNIQAAEYVRVAQDGSTHLPEHSLIVYDEGWMSLGMGAKTKDIRAYMAYLRKVDYVLLIPSVLDLSPYGYLVWCERSLNLGPIGLPLWVYEWGLRGKGKKESGGSFFFLFPGREFGTYDTMSQPYDLTRLFEV